MKPLKTNGHNFTQDGKPFFWLADTGWLMLYQLTIDEINLYLDDRKAKGFNVIQVMLLSSRNEKSDKGIPATQAGHYPFLNRMPSNGWNGNPLQPNELFWQWVDQVVQLAESKEMYLCLLPVWGHHVYPQDGWANPSNLMFPTDSTGISRAKVYCQWLSERYRDFDNVVWMLGGDRLAMGTGYDCRPVWKAMFQGLRTYSNQIITYHPQGGPNRSSTWFHDVVDFNAYQSGHGKDRQQWTAEDYRLQPTKPVIDAECCYENLDWEDGVLMAHDVRKASYRSVFEGGAGVTYGELNVFQFYQNTDPWFGANNFWKNALQTPGATQVGYLKQLMQAYPGGVPDQKLIYEGWGDDGWHSVGVGKYRKVGMSGPKWSMVYIPEIQRKHESNSDYSMGPSVIVNLHGKGDFYAKWFIPALNIFANIGNFINVGYHLFIPPALTPDTVLIIEFGGTVGPIEPDLVEPDPTPDPPVGLKPTVVTVEVTEVGKTSAKVKSRIESFGTSDLTDLGICWGTEPNVIAKEGSFMHQSLFPAFTNIINGLQPGVKYYVRTFADNKSGRAYSNELSFTTQTDVIVTPPDPDPVIKTMEVTVTFEGVIYHGTIKPKIEK